MKKIVLIGASGFVGSALLKEALGRGHQVKAIVRHAGKIPFRHPKLTIVEVDIMDTDALTNMLGGNDVVISAYNPGWKNPDIAEDTLKGYGSIICATRKSGVHRLLIVGGAGSLFVAPHMRLMDSGGIPADFLPAVKSLAKVYLEYLPVEKEIDWVFFSPAGDIFPGERTGKFRLGKDNMIVDEKGKSRISVEDYAVAMLDEVEQPQHHRERFTIGY